MCTIESPIALWSRDYKSGRELIVTPEGQAAIHDTLAKKGYVQIMVDANTRQHLESGAHAFSVMPTWERAAWAGKDYLAKGYDGSQLPRSPIELAAMILHDIARCVLRTFVSAPEGIGSAARLDELLNQSPGGTSCLMIDKFKTSKEDPRAAHCRCHDWYKNFGLLDVVWSVLPGLEVKMKDQTFTLPHGHGYMVTVLTGVTLEYALLHTVRATEQRMAFNGLCRTCLTFRLQLPPTAILDASLLRLGPQAHNRIQPVMVQQVYNMQLAAQNQQQHQQQQPTSTPTQTCHTAPASTSQATANGRKRAAAEPVYVNAQPAKRTVPAAAAAAGPAAATAGQQPAAAGAAAAASGGGSGLTELEQTWATYNSMVQQANAGKLPPGLADSLVRTARRNYEAALQRQQQATAAAGGAGSAAAADVAATAQQPAAAAGTSVPPPVAGTAARMAAGTHNVGAAAPQATAQVPPPCHTVTTQAAPASAAVASQPPPSSQPPNSIPAQQRVHASQMRAGTPPLNPSGAQVHAQGAPQTAAAGLTSLAAGPAMSLEALGMQLAILQQDYKDGRVTQEAAASIRRRLVRQAAPHVQQQYVAHMESVHRQQQTANAAAQAQQAGVAGQPQPQPQLRPPSHAPEVIHIKTSPEPSGHTGAQQAGGATQQQAHGVKPEAKPAGMSADVLATAGQAVHASEGTKQEVKQSVSSGEVKPHVAQASTGESSLPSTAPSLQAWHAGGAAAAGSGSGDGGMGEPGPAADAASPASAAAADVAAAAAAECPATAAAPAAQADGSGPATVCAAAEPQPGDAAAAAAATTAAATMAAAQPDTAAAPAAPAASALAPDELDAAPDSTPKVSIVVRDQQQSEIQFRIKHTTRMGKVIDKYCERRGVDPSTVTFVFDGAKFERFQTPVDLGMVDGDIVDVLSV